MATPLGAAAVPALGSGASAGSRQGVRWGQEELSKKQTSTLAFHSARTLTCKYKTTQTHTHTHIYVYIYIYIY